MPISCRYPPPVHWPDDLAEREAFWDDDEPSALAEHVAAEAAVEPFWLALLGLIGVFVTILGAGAVCYGFFGGQ